MLFDTVVDPPRVQACGACSGTGLQGIFSCTSCAGFPIIAEDGHVVYACGEPPSVFHVRVARGKKILSGMEFGLAFFGAICSFGVFFYTLFSQGKIEIVFSPAWWFSDAIFSYMSWWVGWVFVCFVFYTLFRHAPREGSLVEVLARARRASPPAAQLSTSASFQERRRASGALWIPVDYHLSTEVGEVIHNALARAYKAGRPFVDDTHIFLALLQVEEIQQVFLRLGISIKKLEEDVGALYAGDSSPMPDTGPQLSMLYWEAVFLAVHIAGDRKADVCGITDILEATVRLSERLQTLLFDLAVDTQTLRNVIEWVRVRERVLLQYRMVQRVGARRSKYGMDKAMTALSTPFLNSLGTDVTLQAKYGHFLPCVARDKELEDIFRVLSSGREQVVLVGDPGVGKMTLVEGIADLMVAEKVPGVLSDKRLVQLSASALLSGTSLSGAQERLIRALREVQRARNVVLFIPHIHDLISASSSGGGLDVAKTLAEHARARGTVIIATTTTEAYNKVLVNSEFGSQLTPVFIKEMDDNQAIQVLESRVGGMEYREHVFFSYEAIAKAVIFSRKFLQSERLPQSAIGLATESASAVRAEKGENTLVRGEDVGKIVSRKTGVPTTAISEDESAKLLRLEEEMHTRVVGQDEAVRLVSGALRRARANMRNQKRPIATFLFLGPTGVGKTELAKTIADVYFGNEKRMVRLDMSEYQDIGSIQKMIGVPGMQGTGYFTEAVRQQPFSLILLDELEKANRNVLNLFLQVFDDGRLTDSVGRTIDFTNTIIIATSNAGTAFVSQAMAQGMANQAIRERLLSGELREYFSPEFLNRFDGVVLFEPMNAASVEHIAELLLHRVEADLAEKGIFFRLDAGALAALAKAGFDPQFGARPLRRAVQEYVENGISELVLSRAVGRRDTIVLGADLHVRVEHPVS
jgi:ATP-dependent Clp protease ATP-binding subunit ClpC